MSRFINLFIAFIFCLAFSVSPAFADVVGMLNTAGTSMTNWVMAGALIAVIAIGLMIVGGLRSVAIVIPIMIGVYIASHPEEVLAWLG